MDGLNRSIRIGKAASIAAIISYATFCTVLWAEVSTVPRPPAEEKIAAVIDCHGVIDEGLYKSIVRRSQAAIDAGADYLFYDIQTYGGRVDSADDICKFLIHDVAPRAHTAAYVSKEAISAGAMVSVACKDIIMRTSTTIGCSAPIVMGGTLEGVEREKAESFVRAAFSRAAEANGYPEALLKSMVTQQIEVWQVKNTATDRMEYFEAEFLPTDPNTYDLKNKRLVVKDDEILTLTDSKAYEYGIARAVVKDFDEAMAFLAERDNVTFSQTVLKYDMLWSEELVRWLNSPAVVSVLVLGILLGIYVELNTPGLGLPSLLAVTCLVILVGSRYLTGMANWIEIAILILGVMLLLVEIFLIPGFGVAGFLGIACILIGVFGMFVRTAPGEIPWPKDPVAWDEMTDGLMGVAVGFVAFLVIAIVLARYLDRIPLLRSFVLLAKVPKPDPSFDAANDAERHPAPFTSGLVGTTISVLRPAGKARFGDKIADVVTSGEFLNKDVSVKILEIHGNRIVVAAEHPDS
jgi:membrane-bound serine protease (ClpP class)